MGSRAVALGMKVQRQTHGKGKTITGWGWVRGCCVSVSPRIARRGVPPDSRGELWVALWEADMQVSRGLCQENRMRLRLDLGGRKYFLDTQGGKGVLHSG